MKTVETINEMIESNREGYFDHKNRLENAVNRLVEIYNATTRPDATIAAYEVEVGHDLAVEVIASMVNQKAWDGRIGRETAQWAASQPDSWDENAAFRLGLYSDKIHPAHIDQLACVYVYS